MYIDPSQEKTNNIFLQYTNVYTYTIEQTNNSKK